MFTQLVSRPQAAAAAAVEPSASSLQAHARSHPTTSMTTTTTTTTMADIRRAPAGDEHASGRSMREEKDLFAGLFVSGESKEGTLKLGAPGARPVCVGGGLRFLTLSRADPSPALPSLTTVRRSDASETIYYAVPPPTGPPLIRLAGHQASCAFLLDLRQFPSDARQEGIRAPARRQRAIRAEGGEGRGEAEGGGGWACEVAGRGGEREEGGP